MAIVHFADSTALADATLRFLGDSAFRLATQRKAYDYARAMSWPNVGRRYLEYFDQVASTAEKRLERRYLAAFATPGANGRSGKLLHGGV